MKKIIIYNLIFLSFSNIFADLISNSNNGFNSATASKDMSNAVPMGGDLVTSLQYTFATSLFGGVAQNLREQKYRELEKKLLKIRQKKKELKEEKIKIKLKKLEEKKKKEEKRKEMLNKKRKEVNKNKDKNPKIDIEEITSDQNNNKKLSDNDSEINKNDFIRSDLDEKDSRSLETQDSEKKIDESDKD